MGYCTNYVIEVSSKNKEQLMGVVKAFNEEIGFPIFDEAVIELDGEYSSSTEWESKWYSTDAIIKIAAKYPEVMIVVEGIGEEKEDWWAMKLKGRNYKKAVAEIRSPWEVMEDF